MIPIITATPRLKNLSASALAACLVVLGSACDKVPLLAPPSSTITVTSSDVVLPATGRSLIRATVLEQAGTPVQNGTVVTFTTNLGALAPSEARTQNGVATVEFLGTGQSGKATIRAVSGGNTSEALEITVGAAAASRVTLTANPTTVPPAGGSSTLTAVVFDASGNPLPGVPVTFITNAGTFSNPVVLSDSGGAARTTLTTSQAATVTASAGSATSGNVTINVAARPTVTLALSGTTPPVEGGVTTFAITASPAAGGAPIERVTINYGDGSSDELGSVVSSAQHVYQNDGSYTVTLTATDTSGVSTTASIVIEVQAFVVTITAVQSTSGTSFTFTANVPAGLTMASFSWNFGDTVSNTTTTTTNTAQHEYGTRSGPKTVRVTARTTTNETAQGSITIVVP